jgi:hypothetical protein
MTNNYKIYKITSLLDYIVDFPICINTYSASSIDNIFLDRSRKMNFIIEPYYNVLSGHDAITLTLCNPHINFLHLHWLDLVDIMKIPP